MALTGSSNTQFENCLRLVLGLLFSVGLAVTAFAQTATYHFHQEASSTATLLQLKTAGPDAATVALPSANLKNQLGEQLIKAFDTQSGVPNVSGVIPAGSTITFTLWMNKSVASGVMYPRAKLQLNGTAGTLVCTATGSTALTTTLTQYTLSATTSSSVSMTTSDRFYLWVGVNITTKPTAITNASLNIEGTLGGNYDSFAVIPNPTPPVPTPAITSLLPTNGAVGTAVTITGSNFGVTQGTSSITFNGTTATPTGWSSTSIVAPVPSGTTTGPVVVTVGGSASNGVTFTLAPHINSLSTSSGLAGDSVTISGANFGATQGTSTVTFNGTTATPTSWNATTIVTTVPAAATTGGVIVAVGGQTSNVVMFNVTGPIPPETTTFYLHKEASSTSGRFQLKSTLPDTAAYALLSAELKGLPQNADYLIKEFDTQVNVPNSPGVIPAGSAIQFKLWMKKTADFGEMYPKVKLTINGGATICECHSTTEGTFFPGITNWLTVSIFDWFFTCYTESEITMTATDRLYLWVGVYAYPPANDRVKAELDIEQTRDSNFVMPKPVPRPSIASLSPNSGQIDTQVTINGTNFGATQGISTITFNGVIASPISWNNTSIDANVPIGASSGPVVVTVRNVPSYGVNYSVVSGTISGTVTKASNGSAMKAAFVEALQAGGYVAATRTSETGAYSITGLKSGTYELRVIADDYSIEVRPGIAVTAGSTATVNVTISQPGSIAGRITKTDGTTGIAGATFRVYQGSQLLSKVTTDSGGYYSASGIRAGISTVQATAAGYQSQSQTGLTVSEQTTTTVNLSLNFVSSNNSVNYNYDELGRLVTVENQTGEVAKYSYDATGNLTSISRHTGSQVSILEFTPDSGTVGSVVTIHGTGFSSLASENIVNFNGVAAGVTSSTPTRIVATAPVGVTTGPISITTTTGSGTSLTPFTLDTSAPTITGFSPIIADGGAVFTISGTDFEPSINKNAVDVGVVRAQVTSSTATELNVTVPPNGGSGKVTVNTPTGSAVSTQDFFYPPKDYYQSCCTAAQLEYMGRMAIGESRTVAITIPNKKAMMIFDAVAGQRVGFAMNNTLNMALNVTIFNPDGSIFSAAYLYANSSTFLNSTRQISGGYTEGVPFTGTYTILLDPSNNATGNVSLTLTEPTAAATYAISPGGPTKTISTTTTGQNALVTFRGYAGERISVKMANATVSGLWTIYGPDWGNINYGYINSDPSVSFIDAFTLTTPGTYSILVQLSGTGTRTVDLTLYEVPPDVTNTIIPGGPPVTATTTVPGQDALFNFSGTAGQRVSLNLSSTTAVGWWTFSDLWYYETVDNEGGFVEPTTLPTTSTYHFAFDSEIAAGTVTATLYNVPPDFSGTVTINGSALTATTTAPGQNANLTFSGTSGQIVTVRVTGNTMGSVTVTLLNPDGTTLTSSTGSGTSFNLAQRTLPATGTYKININPSGTNTGSASITVTSP